MPNGVDKNWYRMCASINGFRARYGSWPSKIHIPEASIEPLFIPESYFKLKAKLTLIVDNSPFITEDESGNSYNLSTEGFSKTPPDIQARDWLNLEPDSAMVKEYYTHRIDTKIGKKKDRLRTGCNQIVIAELFLIIIVIITMLALAIKEYQGVCVRWESPITECTLIEYLQQMISLMPLGIMVVFMQYWWAALLLIVLFPILWLSIRNWLEKNKIGERIIQE